MVTSALPGVHLVVGGFPPGSNAAHDMDYARLQLLHRLAAHDARTTVAMDFDNIETWLGVNRFLITYTAGPYPEADQCEALEAWMAAGGRWLALHGSAGGKAARLEDGRPGRRMVRTPHHATLGGFFLNHPPVRRFDVDVAEHALTSGVGTSFETCDELYFVELTDPDNTEILLTTELPEDPNPGFGFTFDEDTPLLPDGKNRAIGFLHSVGDGGVAYYALGHTHSPSTNSQPFFDDSVGTDGVSTPTFRGSWETAGFDRLLKNAIEWGLADRV